MIKLLSVRFRTDGLHTPIKEETLKRQSFWVSSQKYPDHPFFFSYVPIHKIFGGTNLLIFHFLCALEKMSGFL